MESSPDRPPSSSSRNKRKSPKTPRAEGERWFGRIEVPDSNGSYYCGDLLQGPHGVVLKDGYGVFEDKIKNKTYKGGFVKDLKQGQGTTTYVNKMHQGSYFRNLRHGQGSFFYYDSGFKYHGEFKFGEFDGRGTLTTHDANFLENGTWRRGKLVSGAKLLENGSVFHGHFDSKGLPTGFGRSYWENGNIHQGMYVAGVPHGKGELYERQSDTILYAHFHCGKVDGKMKFVRVTNPSSSSSSSSPLCFAGLQVENKLWGRLDGDGDAGPGLPAEEQVMSSLGEFSRVGDSALQIKLCRGTYSTSHTTVTCLNFDDHLSVNMEPAAYHNVETGQVRFSKLGQAGPVGRTLFVSAVEGSSLVAASIEVFNEEGVLHELIHL